MKKIINICGAGRTGTTLLDLIIGNDTRAFSLGEVYAWHRPWRTHHYKIKCSCGEEPCPEWEKIKFIKEKHFHKQAFEKLDVDFLVDSSKEVTWLMDVNLWYTENSSIEVVNFLMYKDPISHIYSYWKRGKSINAALKDYKSYYLKILKGNLPFISINYDRFVEFPEKYLYNMCQILKMDYSAEKLNFGGIVSHHLFGSMGTRKQMMASSSKIDSNQEYQKEFIDIIPQIEKLLEKDKDIHNIVSNLKQFELMTNADGYKSKKINKFSYYYLKKIKSKIKRYFPDKWHYEQ